LPRTAMYDFAFAASSDTRSSSRPASISARPFF